MSTHGEDRSAGPHKVEAITATTLKMLEVALAESVPLNLPEEKAKWWVGQQGGKLLMPEIQSVLWNPPTLRREAGYWSRFYKILLGIDVPFHMPKEMELQAAENWIFVPPEDPNKFENGLHSCCEKFFPAYKKEKTTGTAGGNTKREGKKYIIRIEQEDTGNCWPPSWTEGMEVTLAELLARELYFFFRGARRPKSNKMYAVGSLFEDGKVPALRWTTEGLELLHIDRGACSCRSFRQLQVLE